MKKYYLIVFTAVLFIVYQTTNAQDKIPRDKKISTISEMMDNYSKMNLYSGVVGVVQNDKVIYSKAFGYSDLEKNIPNTLTTEFRLASVSKLFTIVGILMLYDQGKLDVDDKIGKYIDGFPPEIANRVTIRHLIKLKSGFGDYLTDPEYRKNRFNFIKVDSLMRLVRKEKLKFRPGWGNLYSNSGFVVLGAIIEKVSGQDYYEFIREKIFVPLDMKSTYFFDPSEGSIEALRYKLEINGSYKQVKTTYPPSPAGNAASTVDDLIRFATKVCSTNILSEEAKKVLFFKVKTSYKNDRGEWVKASKKKETVFAWVGGLPGITTALTNFIERNLIIITLSNLSNSITLIEDNIFSVMSGGFYNEVKLPPAQSIYRAYNDNGIEYVRTNYKQLAGNSPSNADILINIGYELAGENKLQDAIKIFTLSTELFPKNPNTWDSLAENYLKAGNKNEAIKYYKMALQVDPNFGSSVKALKDLGN